MKKKLSKLVWPLVIVVVALSILVYLDSGKGVIYTVIVYIIYTIFQLTIEGIIPKVISLFERDNWKTNQRKLEKEGKLMEDTIIRISFAYLYRIKIDDKYFLVQNTRTNKYQPVGGAYKYKKDEANYLSTNIPVENDDCIPVDKVTNRDYRLLVKNKDLKAFVRRFNKTTYRETVDDLSREFIEELFSSNILKREDFGDLTYKYCGRHMTDIQETVFKPFEMLLADIIETKLSDKQENLLRNLIHRDSPHYKFATSNEIKSLGMKIGTHILEDNIANHTYKILVENSDKLLMRNKYKETITISL